MISGMQLASEVMLYFSNIVGPNSTLNLVVHSTDPTMSYILYNVSLLVIITCSQKYRV